jgi:hypothetical protein
MEIEYELTAEDYVAFNLYNIRHSPGIKKRMMTTRIILALFMLAFTLGMGYLMGITQLLFVYILLMAIGVGIFIFFYYPRSVESNLHRQIPRMLKEGKVADSTGMRKVRLAPEGLFNVRPSGEIKVLWDALDRLAAAPDYVFIYTGDMKGVVIPQRAFEGEVTREAFIQEAQKAYKDATGKELTVVGDKLA